MRSSQGAPLPHAPSNSQLGAFAFLILFASVIGLISSIQVVRSFSPTVASTFAYVNPVVGILLGWPILDEVPEPLALAGMAIVLISIALILKRRVDAGTENSRARKGRGSVIRKAGWAESARYRS